MTTPDFKDAPEWVNYVAMDLNGDWYWYEDEPVPGYDEWVVRDGDCSLASEAVVDWREALQKRPAK